MQVLSRRTVIGGAIKVVFGLAAVPALVSRASAQSACVEESSASLRESMRYVDPAPDSGASCGKCAFFTDMNAKTCGPCTIMSGPVSASAHCDSWSARS